MSSLRIRSAIVLAMATLWNAWVCLLIPCYFTSAALADLAKIPAFPGAEGFGKYTQGGRGGDVYHVTNLEDAGEGSLRFGIVNAQAPRTIVFDIGGTITLKSPLKIEGKSYLTIAGQTSPGKGITLRDHNVSLTNSQHVVIRYLRMRLGDENKPQNSAPDVMTVDYNDHVVLDHLSLSWGIDGNSDYRGNKSMTLQWLFYSEALNRSLHGEGEHAMATSLRDCRGNTTVHHNVYSTSRNRHPTLGSGVAKGGSNWIVDYRNCLNYNWKGSTNLGGLQMNVVGNYYRPGPCTQDLSVQPLQLKDHDTTTAKGFARDNYFEGMHESFNQDNFSAVEYTNQGNYMSTTRHRWELSQEIECDEFAVPTQSAPEAYETCLKYSGCSRVRDTVDERMIRNIIMQEGEVIDSQKDVGGWDNYRAEQRPPDWDVDLDGMSDSWERANGLNPKYKDDRNGDADGDGYTNLEEYLNGLCPGLN